MSNKKYVDLGVVWDGQYGPYLSFGRSNAKDEKYNFEVQILVKDSKGNKITVVKNPRVSLRDPRRNEKRDASKIPEKLLYEVTLVQDEENVE